MRRRRRRRVRAARLREVREVTSDERVKTGRGVINYSLTQKFAELLKTATHQYKLTTFMDPCRHSEYSHWSVEVNVNVVNVNVNGIKHSSI